MMASTRFTAHSEGLALLLNGPGKIVEGARETWSCFIWLLRGIVLWLVRLCSRKMLLDFMCITCRRLSRTASASSTACRSICERLPLPPYCHIDNALGVVCRWHQTLISHALFVSLRATTARHSRHGKHRSIQGELNGHWQCTYRPSIMRNVMFELSMQDVIINETTVF